MSSASRQPEPRRPAPASPFGKRLLAATAAVSAAALLIGGMFAVRAFRGDQREVRVDLARAVRDAEAEADRFLQDRLAVLSGLAATPAVVQGDRPAMQKLFTAIVGDRVILDDIGWTPLDGRGAVLAGVPLADTAEVDLSQREYLQAVRATGRPYVSDGLVAQLRPAPVVVLAVPSADAAGAPTGVVTGLVRLDVLTPSGAALGGGRSVSIIDRAGRRIVAPAPIPELTPAPPELLARLRAAGEDRAVAIDGVPSLDGGPRQVAAVAPLERAGWLVVAARSERAAYGPATEELAQKLATWSAFAAVAMLGAWRLGARVDRAAAARQARTQGQLDARAAVSAAVSFDEVVDAFCEHAQRLLSAWTAVLVLDEPPSTGDDDAGDAGAAGLRACFASNHPLRGRWSALPEHSPVGEAIAAGRPALAGDPGELRSRYPGLGDRLIGEGIQAVAAAPLPPFGGRAPGAVAVTFRAPRRLDAHDWALLEDLAEQAGQAVLRSRAHDAERAARELAEGAWKARELLAGLTAALSRAATPGEAAEIVAETAVKGLGADAAGVHLLEPDGETLALAGRRTAGGARPPSCEPRAPGGPAPAPLVGEALLAGGARLGAAAAAFPLCAGGRPIGALELRYDRPQPFDQAQTALLAEVADRAAEALSRARLYEAERRATQRADTLLRFTEALGSVMTVDAVAEVIVRAAAAAVDAEGAAVWLLNSDRDAWWTAAAWGELDAPEGRASGPGASGPGASGLPGPAAEALHARAPVFIERAEPAGAAGPAGAAAALALGAGSAPPLGALLLVFPRPRRFPPAERELMAALAAQGSDALVRAASYAEQLRARADAEALNEVMTALEAGGGVRARAQRLVELLVPRLADFALVEAHGDPAPLVLAAADAGPAAAAAAAASPGAGRLLAAPLRTAGGPSVGAEQEGGLTLKVGRSDPARRPFDRREAELVRGAAARAAVALEAARLAEQEHATALALQRALLPSSTVERADLATAARYRPGDARLQVGGDWYETVPLADGRVAVAVGDVVGRGLAAAAVMGQLRTAFAALAPGGASPGVLLDELDAFARRVEGASYSTMCCAFVDPARGELRYASAGHPPMLVVEPGAEPRYLEDGRSQPLGAGPPRARPEAEAPLPPGATLLLYSDGLVERRREPLERSLRRLAAAAASAAKLDVGPLCDEVLAALTAGRRLDDDLVLLAVAAQPDRQAACEPAAPSRAGER